MVVLEAFLALLFIAHGTCGGIINHTGVACSASLSALLRVARGVWWRLFVITNGPGGVRLKGDLLYLVQHLLQPVQQFLYPVPAYPMGSLSADILFR
jgi:hypothetical protein